MTTYIYFVKCPNCEDEPFDFFDEAKEFAFGCMSKKPVITQIEVERNDFGECTDSHDLGTVWSWEDVMKETDAEPAIPIFTKDDLARNYDPDSDPEFANLEDCVCEDQCDSARLQENIQSEINQGDLVDFGTYGQLYVCNPTYSSDYYWVTDLEEDRNDKNASGWSIRKDLAKRIIDSCFDESCKKAISEGMADWNSTVPGYYGEHIFALLDKMTGDDINNFMHEYNWFDTLKSEAADALCDKYDRIRDYLDTESGRQLWSDLDKYCAYRGIIESLKESTDNSRKPIPEGMTIEQLKEEMEENEDTVECVGCEELFPKEDCFHKDGIGWLCSDCEDTVVKCTWCEELFDKSQCRYEVDLGWLCSRCEMAIKSRGETLTFRENNFLDEAKVLKETFNPREWIAFDYDELEIEAVYGRQDPDDGSYPSVNHKGSYTYWKRAEDVAEDLWDRFITEEDAKDIPGGLEALEDEAAWIEFLNTHFDSLVEKHYEELLEYYEETAKAEFEQEFDYDDYVDGVRSDMAYDDYRDSLCEKLEEADEYRKHLTACPECGDSTFDAGTGFCIGCGFN